MTPEVALEQTMRAVYYDGANRPVVHDVPRCQEMLRNGRQCGAAAFRDRATRESTGRCGSHRGRHRAARKQADAELDALKVGMDEPWMVDVMAVTASLIQLVDALLREHPDTDIGYVLAGWAGAMARAEPPDEPAEWSDLAQPVVNVTAGTIVQALAMFAWSIQEAERER
jgi:hypothetical protein